MNFTLDATPYREKYVSKKLLGGADRPIAPPLWTRHSATEWLKNAADDPAAADLSN